MCRYDAYWVYTAVYFSWNSMQFERGSVMRMIWIPVILWMVSRSRKYLSSVGIQHETCKACTVCIALSTAKCLDHHAHTDV